MIEHPGEKRQREDRQRMAEANRQYAEQVINRRVANVDKRLEEARRQESVRRNYPTPEELAERLARIELLMQERSSSPKPAVEPVDLRDFDH
jgi:hypothetical protein